MKTRSKIIFKVGEVIRTTHNTYTVLGTNGGWYDVLKKSLATGKEETLVVDKWRLQKFKTNYN